ncbi:MAG: molybdate ABC transporter permease subunit [Syntrophaceae bacterium]|nr:molybdate ABC transporter permease subunit [Syntrophaceae bacterium]
MDYLAIYVTLKLALVTTVVLMFIAAPIAYALSYYRFSGKSFLEALIYLPMALPPTVIGFYLIILMGPKGIVGKIWQMLTGGSLLFTFIGITMASIIYSIPFAVQPMKAAFSKIDRRLLESAYVLGLSKKATFFRVIIPNSVSGIAAAAILVFLHSIGAFGVLLMVGGSIPGETKVASIAIYEAVEMMNYKAAGMIALSFIPISYTFLLLINKLNERTRT